MIACTAPGCVRGLVHHAEWADPCALCDGRGEITLAELSRRIGENESTLTRLLKNRPMRARTCARIAGKLADLLSP